MKLAFFAGPRNSRNLEGFELLVLVAMVVFVVLLMDLVLDISPFDLS